MNGLHAINITVDINAFVLCWCLAGIVSPFIVFFSYGLLAHSSKLSAYTKLAVGWGSGCLFLPVWLTGVGLFFALIGQNPPDSVPAFFAGTVQGTLLLTVATVGQWHRINEQEKKARKKAYSFS